MANLKLQGSGQEKDKRHLKKIELNYIVTKCTMCLKHDTVFDIIFGWNKGFIITMCETILAEAWFYGYKDFEIRYTK